MSRESSEHVAVGVLPAAAHLWRMKTRITGSGKAALQLWLRTAAVDVGRVTFNADTTTFLLMAVLGWMPQFLPG